MIYLELFLSFVQIGMFSFGGGYAALGLIQRQAVEVNAWLSLTEFTDLITISEMTPGPIAINAATFIGTRVAGLPGALVATFGCILPSCIITLTLAWLYYKYRSLSLVSSALMGLRPAVAALIAAAGLSILTLALWNGAPPALDPRSFDWIAVGLFASALFALRRWKLNPILVMSAAGIVGLGLYSLMSAVA
jgi:chromate transporter